MNHFRGLSMITVIATMTVLLVAILIAYGLKPDTALAPSAENAPENVAKGPEITWLYSNASSTDEAMPMTTVAAFVNGIAHEAGTFAGQCKEIDATGGIDGKGLVEGEITATQCWFAGGGDEIAVFLENGKLILKKGELGEGTPESPFFRGNFTTIKEL